MNHNLSGKRILVTQAGSSWAQHFARRLRSTGVPRMRRMGHEVARRSPFFDLPR